MKSGENRMSEKDFDNLLKSIMEQETLHTSAPEAGWNKIFNELHPDTGKQPRAVPFATASRTLQFRKWAAVACGIAAAVFGSYWVLQHTDSGDTALPSQQMTTQKEALPPVTGETNIALPSQNEPTIEAANSTHSHYTRAVQPADQKPAPGRTVLQQPEDILRQQQEPVIEVQERTVVQETLKEIDVIETKPNKTEQATINTNPYLNYDNNRYTYAANSGKSSSVGINGGYNFGTLNSGYAVALTARTQLTDELFIGGSLGIAMNNMQTTSSTALSVPVSNVKARPGANNMNSINTPAVTNSTHQLAYVQFNPSIGYNITKNLTFSVGGDVQRLVNTKSDEVNVIFNAAQNQSAIIPKTDLGVTGKTEFRISKNLSTGLVYREGINNILSNAPGDVGYLNRRYIQVQMSYTIPVKL